MSTATAVDARLPTRATVRRGAPPVLANTTPSATIGAAKTVIAKTADEVWDMARHDDVRELGLATAGRVMRMRLLALIFLVALGPDAAAQPPAPRPATAVSGRGAFWALSVADVKSMSQWYADKFGLHVTLDPPTTGGAKAIVLEGDGLIVELIQHENAKPRRVIAPAASDAVLIHGIMKAGIVVDDFDKTIASFRAAPWQPALNAASAPGPRQPSACFATPHVTATRCRRGSRQWVRPEW